MFKIGDEVYFSQEYFVGSKSSLIKKYGTGIITSEACEFIYDKHLSRLVLPTYPRWPSRIRPRRQGIRPYFKDPICLIGIKWEGFKEECYEHIEYFSLVKEAKKRNIYMLFEQEMNK